MSALTFLALRQLADGRFHSGEDISRSLGRSRATLSEALKLAPGMGLELFSVRGKGYRLAEPIDFLDGAALGRSLAGTRMKVEVLDEVDSTSTRLLAMAAGGAPSGTCVAAEWQTAGRGRRGRAWISALGGSLTFSVLWRFERGAAYLGGLPLAVGAVLAQTLSACGAERVQVKWPNDVVVDFRKLAGILVETSGEAAQGPSVAVIGIGINYRLGERALDRIDQPVIDVARCCASPPSRTELLARVLRALGKALERFERDGFAPFRAAWRSLHAYHDRRVRILPPGDAAFDAKVLDIAPDGALLVARDDGRVEALSSAELSLRPR